MRGYRFTTQEAAGWRIDFGYSRFLIAEGSGFSRRIGRELFARLQFPPQRKAKPVRRSSVKRSRR